MTDNKNAALGIGVVGAAIGAAAGLFLSNEQNRKKLRGWYDDLMKEGSGVKDEFESTAHEIRKGVTRRLEQASGNKSKGKKSRK